MNIEKDKVVAVTYGLEVEGQLVDSATPENPLEYIQGMHMLIPAFEAGLEGLVGQVPGLLDVKVHIDGRLSSSNADVMLDSTLESEEALKGYATHPAHVAVANEKVRPFTVQRSCLDFEITP